MDKSKTLRSVRYYVMHDVADSSLRGTLGAATVPSATILAVELSIVSPLIPDIGKSYFE
jgi:hypothetical protein